MPNRERGDSHQEIHEMDDDGQEYQVRVEVPTELLESQRVRIVVGLLGEREFDVSDLVDGMDQKSDNFEDEEGDPVMLEISRIAFEITF